ncbi:hypothetical protein RCL_jg27851.t1 [Rhizophagus clarus]|uniref:Uncharacterized protein n=1 Tax=Rhizophagus clarus TaxID=94130 RepID=A0A8H3QND6_9GLOM|nr:hypothetical protein RCL_jg27851.t1 [Rhizophagus clarus]
MIFQQVLGFNLISISAPSAEICLFWFYISDLYQFPAIEANSHLTFMDHSNSLTKVLKLQEKLEEYCSSRLMSLFGSRIQ